jgi:hypothetical protein
VKGARRQRQPARLLHHRGQDLRMAVALIHRGIGGEAIEVAMALRIPNKDALAARQNDAERFVVPGAKARFPRDEISDRWIHVSSLQSERTGRHGLSPFSNRRMPDDHHQVSTGILLADTLGDAKRHCHSLSGWTEATRRASLPTLIIRY